MERTPVNSSNLASVGYDGDTSILEIEFHEGDVYQYFDVPVNVYNGLVSSSSAGAYFSLYIRDSYQYIRV